MRTFLELNCLRKSSACPPVLVYDMPSDLGLVFLDPLRQALFRSLDRRFCLLSCLSVCNGNDDCRYFLYIPGPSLYHVNGGIGSLCGGTQLAQSRPQRDPPIGNYP